jgi:4-diphosphocytidyl-2-C-methyl-D-erythritol kinase
MKRLETKDGRVQIFAPAKINLTLHILGRREDGFHELETLMVPISLGDDLIFERISSPAIEIISPEVHLPSGPENLIYRAVELFREATDWRAGVRVTVTKRIPIGAGLGGGSSDGASALLALEALSGCNLGRESLERLAAQMGSDAAFFIQARAAVCRGRGEIIEPIALAETYPGVLINPGFGVATPWAYKTYAAHPQRGQEGRPYSFGPLRNDLEPAVFLKYVWIATAKQWLQAQPEVEDALMSGSGSSLFAIFKKEMDDIAVELFLQKFREEFGPAIRVWPITINSPLD